MGVAGLLSRQWSAGAVMEALVDAVRVACECSGKSAVDEDVTVEAGHDRDRALAVVFGADGDAITAGEAQGAAIHDASVELALRAEWPVRGTGLRCCGPHVAGSLSVHAAM